MAHEKHTPGPWRVREMGTNERGPVLAIQSELYTIAEYIQPIDDARLIAAAPDLLTALLEVISVSDRATVEYDRAKAAIAKALGE